jgi:hypothetical protein
MSEPIPAPTTDGKPPEGAEPKVFDAEYVANLRKESARYRTEAKAGADAVARLAEIEEAQKSEAQKAADRVAAAEAKAAASQSEALRLRIAAKFGIGDEDADLFLTGSDEETLKKQAERLADRAGQQRSNGNRVPREGASPKANETEESAFARQVFDQT